jgi:hypothetical protein
MLRYDAIKTLYIFQCSSHQQWIVNAVTVITEYSNASRRVMHRTKFSQLLPSKTYGDCTDWLNMYQADLLTDSLHLLNYSSCISNRKSVGHGMNRGVATGGG